MNKIDNLEDQQPRIERDEEGVPQCVWVSAMDGQGIDLLFQALTERLAGQMVEHTLLLPPELVGCFRSKFFQMHSIIKEEYQDDGSLLIDIRMQQVDWSKLEKREETPLSHFLMMQ